MVIYCKFSHEPYSQYPVCTNTNFRAEPSIPCTETFETVLFFLTFTLGTLCLLIIGQIVTVLFGVDCLKTFLAQFVSQFYALVATTKPEDEVKSRLLLDVVVAEGAAVLQLLSSEDEPLLVRGDSLLVLDLGLDVLDGVGSLNLQGDCLASESLDKDLHFLSCCCCAAYASVGELLRNVTWGSVI